MAILIFLKILSTDLQCLLQYANGCLEFKNYFESIEVCETIMKTTENSSSDIIEQAKITKGKARFYSYKRKLHYLLLNPNMRVTKEGRLILDECFNNMKEAIILLGNGLDLLKLDEEGAKLFDWAMIDCLSTTNQLNLCKRCLLCRQKKELRRSHVWPKFFFETQNKDFVFGLDKYQLKSAGQCHYWMLCARCEQILSQNGESDFKTEFPTSGEVTNSPWLFSFCAGVIFRTLSIVIQFPLHFNDSEIHKIFLHCRKHLLSLPVKGDYKACSLSDYKLARQLKGNLDLYLFMSPLESKQNFDVFQVPYPYSAFALSRNKQLDSKSLVFNGYAHFFCIWCGPITIIVQFDHSLISLKNKGFHITSNPSYSDQKYTIPSEEDRVKILPVGVWPLMEQLTEGSIENANQVSRFRSSKFSKLPTSQLPQTAHSVDIPSEADSKTVFQVSYLPKEYEIIKPTVRLPRNQCVVLPEGHNVIIHASRTVPMQNAVITVLLCIKPSSNESLIYVIILVQDKNKHTLYVDGADAEVRDSKLVLTKYLLSNKIIDEMRISLSQLNNLLDVTSPNKHFDNINLLMYLVKSRRYVVVTVQLTVYCNLFFPP